MHRTLHEAKLGAGHWCIVGRMKSMDAMKPFMMFMTVLNMYTKECLHSVREGPQKLDWILLRNERQAVQSQCRRCPGVKRSSHTKCKTPCSHGQPEVIGHGDI